MHGADTQTFIEYVLDAATQDHADLARALRECDVARKALAKAQIAVRDRELRAAISRQKYEEITGDRVRFQRGKNSGTQDSSNGPITPPVTVGKIIRKFLQGRPEATITEIVDHVRESRPLTTASRVSPELTRLIKRREITRVRQGVYRLVSENASSVA